MKKQVIFIITVLCIAFGANAQNWNTPQMLDNGGGAMVGESSSLLMVSGNPAMSYYDEDNGNLKYVRATNSAGDTWGSPVVVQSSNHVGEFTSMQIVSSNPAISYYDQTNGNLMYVRATNTTGSTWGTPVTVTSSNNIGQYTSMQIVSSNPAIAYYDVTNGNLMYVRATNTTGTTWGTPVTVASTNNVGMYAQLRIVNGNPAIAYYDATNGNLMYIRATNTTGSTWGTAVTVQSTNSIGSYCSMEVVSGNPAIAYYDATGYDLEFVRANDASGSTWGTPITLDATGDVGQYASLKIINSYPAVAYFDVTNGDLKYVRATTTTGSSWGTAARFETTGDIGEYACLQEINGYPAVSYHDDTNDDLRYVNLCNSWTGASSTAWATATNWSFASVPVSTEHVHIYSKPNQPLVSSSTTVSSLKIYSGATVSLTNSTTAFTISGALDNSGVIAISNADLILGGAVTGTGTLTGGSTSSLEINGTAGTIYFTSGSRSLNTLTLGSSGTATLGTALDIAAGGTLTVTSGGVLTTNGNTLTLKSTSAGTARVAAGSSSGSYIVGNVTVETYIPGGRRAFRFIGHPFSNSIGLNQLTDDIDITGTNGPTNGFDYQPGNPSSAFWYNPATGNGSTVNDIGWTAFTHTDGSGANSWDKGEAVRVLVRGSKGQGIYAGAYTPNPVTLDVTGTLNQGTTTVSFTKGSNTPFVLMSNPFQSPINMLLTTRTSLGLNLVVWNSNQGTKGGYTSLPILDGIIIPAGASFVTTVLSNGSVIFPEACKTSSTGLGLLKTTSAMPYQLNLRIEDSLGRYWDRLLLKFADSISSAYDPYDQLKLYNPEVSVYTYSTEDSILSIDCRKHIDSQVIRMGMYMPYKQWYKMVAADFNMELGTKLYLRDKYLNTIQEITTGFEYWFEVNTDTASTGNNRFEFNMLGKPTKTGNGNSTAVNNTAKQNTGNEFSIKLVPNPAKGNVTVKCESMPKNEVAVNITNMMGAVVYSATKHADVNGNIPVSLQQLPAGMYLVEVKEGDKKSTEKLIVE